MTANYPESGSGAYAGDPTGPQSGAAGAKAQAQQAAGTAADETKHVAGVAQGEAQHVAAEAKSQVQDLVGQATSQVEEQSRTQLGRLAGTLRSYGDDLEKMAAQSDGPASGLAREAAERVQGLSSHLEGREPRDLLDDVRSFARRKPGVFLGGALIAGIVAGRLTRGAKAANDGTAGSTGRTGGPSYAGAPSTYQADVTSPGAPLSTGYAAPSSGPFDHGVERPGTATGDPLAGTGRPTDQPVYPGGSDVRGDLS
jgi:hypothetical protein